MCWNTEWQDNSQAWDAWPERRLATWQFKKHLVWRGLSPHLNPIKHFGSVLLYTVYWGLLKLFMYILTNGLNTELYQRKSLANNRLLYFSIIMCSKEIIGFLVKKMNSLLFFCQIIVVWLWILQQFVITNTSVCFQTVQNLQGQQIPLHVDGSMFRRRTVDHS